ncbi:hypothetical protein B0H16DRAFT_1890103 [Mycena metata]|uniref:F-box domain-containing protein n=1 Tax=Mycena metata TaxID=1033252 RepID=A0AAD7IJF3_9AGAR|nr:hypothetical protein B0H16DRAFT_1890103 [Mycena metata]
MDMKPKNIALLDTVPRLKEERQRRLTEEKISIQRSLNSIVYPILSLPVEVTTEVFLSCLPDEPVQPSEKVAPMLLGRVCRHWRDIACSTPRLWAALLVRLWGGPSFELLVRLWLRRARAVPLSLTLELPYGHCFDSFFTGRGCFCPSSLPFTEHWANLSSFHGICFTPAECLDLLSLAPRLTHCEFNRIPVGLLATPTSTSHLLLTNLEHLELNPLSADIRPLLLVLDWLSLPALRSLKISGAFMNPEAATFHSFLERAPSLQTFDGSFGGTVEHNGLVEILRKALRAMPLLTSLRLIADPTSIANIMRILNESPTFLPRIQNMDLFTPSIVHWPDSFTTSLIDGLTSRWEAKSGVAQLVDFRYFFIPEIRLAMDGRLMVCISKLRGKGMRIRVGPNL